MSSTVTTSCPFAWCDNEHPGHVEHTWSDAVDGASLCGRPMRANVWTSIQEGYDEPIMVSVEAVNTDDVEEIWLTAERAVELRDALTTAIENARV